MVHPEKKYLDDLKRRIEFQPGSVTYKMLVRAIPAEIQSKQLIPRFVKNEICRSMLKVKEFVAANEWGRKSLSKSLMKLYHAVVDVKSNHEGYVRVEYAKFRENFDDLQDRTLPPQLIQMPSDIKGKLDRIRGGGTPVSVINYRERLNGAECIDRRRAILDSPTIQHYRAAGIRIFGSMSEDIDVPRTVADAEDVQKLIDELWRCADCNPVLRTQSVDIALTVVAELLKEDALWMLTCTSIQQSLANILQALGNKDPKETVDIEVRSVLDTVIPFLRRLEDWKKTEDINKGTLKAEARRNHLTPDEMLMQAKRLQNENPDDCV